MNIETVVQLQPVLGLRWWSIEPSAFRIRARVRQHYSRMTPLIELKERVAARIYDVTCTVWEMWQRRRRCVYGVCDPSREGEFPQCPLAQCACRADFLRAARYERALCRLNRLLARLSATVKGAEQQQVSYSVTASLMVVPCGAGAQHDLLAWGHPDGEARANREPTLRDGDEFGLYAYALGSYSRFLEAFREDDYRAIAVGGLVALSGVIVEHADGVLRASHAQIREIYVVPRYVYVRRRARLMARQLQAHYPDALVRVMVYPELVAHVRGLLLNES